MYKEIWKDIPGYEGKYGKKVAMIDKNTGEIIKIFNCVADANEYLGKPRNSDNISQCARDTNETAYGYIWRYEEGK